MSDDQSNQPTTETDPLPIDELTAVKKQRPFRKAVLRGLGVLLPPLLTIVLFLWAWNIIVSYVLEPIENTALWVCMINADIHDSPPSEARPIAFIPASRTDVVDGETSGNVQRVATLYEERDGFLYNDQKYIRVKQKYIPETVFNAVEQNPGEIEPTTPDAYYRRYFRMNYLGRLKTIPIFLLLFVLSLYLVGKFLAAGIGRWVWNGIESLVTRIPLISNVYTSVKQVTDFAFSQTELQYTRVVAVQYPRKGCWSLGFVTGEGMLDVRMAANEPVMAVLIPTSPMPATGYTVTVPKSETIDLNITIDQAIQFCVSCGVVVPGHQQQTHLNGPADPNINPALGVQQFLPKETDSLSSSSEELSSSKDE